PVMPAGGGETTLQWQVSDADTLSVQPGVGEVTGTFASVTVTQRTTFTLRAENGAGTTEQEVTVDVTTLGYRDEQRQLQPLLANDTAIVGLVADAQGNLYAGVRVDGGSNLTDSYLIKYTSQLTEVW